MILNATWAIFEEDSNLKHFKIFEVFETFQILKFKILKFEFKSTAHLEEQCSSDPKVTLTSLR